MKYSHFCLFIFLQVFITGSTGTPSIAEYKESSYRSMLERHALENGVPVALADAVVRLESGYNPLARNGPNLGLGQINFKTAQSLGYKGSASGLLDADTNLTYTLKYLRIAYNIAKGDTCGTIMRYQNGPRSRHFTHANRIYCAKAHKIMG